MEERRQDYPDILTRLAILETLQEKDLKDAEAWRNRFCVKLEEINKKFDKIAWTIVGVLITLVTTLVVTIIK